MQLYSHSLSAVAISSSIIMSEIFPACFFCRNSFVLSHSSLGLDENHLVSHLLRDPAMIAGD